MVAEEYKAMYFYFKIQMPNAELTVYIMLRNSYMFFIQGINWILVIVGWFLMFVDCRRYMSLVILVLVKLSGYVVELEYSVALVSLFLNLLNQ